MNFTVQTIDDSGSVQRVLVLYRRLSDRAWSHAELPYNGGTHMASASVTLRSP